MKITEIDVRLVDANFRNLIITQIHTNKGITGASEVVTKRFDDATMHAVRNLTENIALVGNCLLYTSPSPRDMRRSRMPSSA